jgi:hypothetical protein
LGAGIRRILLPILFSMLLLKYVIMLWRSPTFSLTLRILPLHNCSVLRLFTAQLLTIASLGYPILTLRSSCTTKPPTLIILCIIIQVASPKEQLQQPSSRSQLHGWVGFFYSIFLDLEMRSGIHVIDARSISNLPRESLAFGSFQPERIETR